MNSKCMNDPPIFARCSVGKNRWFWVIWTAYTDILENKCCSHGYSESSDAAENAARAVIRDDLGHDDPWMLAVSAARKAHRRMNVKKRSQRASRLGGPAVREYVYSDVCLDYHDGIWASEPHRIVKKTLKRVYVERDTWSWTEGENQYHDVETLALDREELERQGHTYSRRQRERFYLLPYEERYEPSVRPCFNALGLKEPCSRAEVEHAYRRLALKHHPDQGGDAEVFKQIHEAYEQALVWVTA